MTEIHEDPLADEIAIIIFALGMLIALWVVAFAILTSSGASGCPSCLAPYGVIL